jgi:CheY-like chemotaxis protein
MVEKIVTKRILIVDDEPNIAMVWANALTKLNGPYELLVAENVAQALTFADEGPIELLITDFNMPDMDGLTLVETLRRKSPNFGTILITAFATEQLEQQAAQLEITRFLTKPVSLTDIRRVVREVLDCMNTRPPPAPAPKQIRVELAKQLTQLVRDTGARCALLISKDGMLIEATGHLTGLDTQVLSTLMAANFVAMEEFARLLGNPRSFEAVNHESKEDNIYTCVVDGHHLLIVIFSHAIKPGSVWYYAKKSLSSLAEWLRQIPRQTVGTPPVSHPKLEQALDDALFST